MDIRKDGEKESSTGTFPLWEQKFYRYIRDNAFPRAAWDDLLAAGCQRQTLTGLLYPYCLALMPAKAPAKSRGWRVVVKKLNHIARELDEVILQIEELSEGSDPPRITQQFRTFAELMRAFGPAIEGETNLRHSYGPSFYLVRLSLYIREATGGNYRDKELAYLVEAAFGAAGQDKHFDEDAVRKCRDRLRERNLTSYERLARESAEYFTQFGRHGDSESVPSFLEWCSSGKERM